MKINDNSQIFYLLRVDLSRLGSRTIDWKALVSSIKRRVIGWEGNIELLSKEKVANLAKFELMSLHMSWRTEEIQERPQSGESAFRLTCELSIYRVSQEERSIFWKVIVSVILSKNIYMNMCPNPNGFRDRAIWMYNRKIVDKKEILRVRTVSNTDIYCSSDRVGRVYNKCSKISPSTSMHFATRVKTWRVVRLSASWGSFMQTITYSMLTSSSSRLSTLVAVHSNSSIS